MIFNDNNHGKRATFVWYTCFIYSDSHGGWCCGVDVPVTQDVMSKVVWETYSKMIYLQKTNSRECSLGETPDHYEDNLFGHSEPKCQDVYNVTQ